MFPKTESGQRAHRELKRHMEIDLITKELSNSIKNTAHFNKKDINILEFGSGDGFQISYLSHLGKVIACDIYTSNGIKNLHDFEFVECEINNAPFKNEQFDIIFSNHVIEHIEDLTNALRETQRIGSSSCIYAFSVPTNLWLLLSIPTQYYIKFLSIIKKIRKPSLETTTTCSMNMDKKKYNADKNRKIYSKFSKWIHSIMPGGHGVCSNFIKCYENFKIKRWQQLFCNNGFSIIKIKPLLLYGPSEWPIIPIFNCKTCFCSSVLFLMKKKIDKHQ